MHRIESCDSFQTMKISVFSTKAYDRESLGAINQGQHELNFLEPRLNATTAPLAEGSVAVCPFVNDVLDAPVLTVLAGLGVKLIVLRCAGFNNVDLDEAKRLGLVVARVPEYSPYSVAEHTVGMMLNLNRQFNRAYNRVREANFSLDGLLGFDMHGRTAGIIGTGKIGAQVCRILLGMGCNVLAYDKFSDDTLEQQGVKYCRQHELLSKSDIISLHCPLNGETFHLVNENSLAVMKNNVMLINTSRGGLLDTAAVLRALKSGQIGYLGLDVYEEEAALFFEDRSGHILQDDVFARLLTFRNVLITGHQAFFTEEALSKIASVTFENINAFASDGTVPAANRVI